MRLAVALLGTRALPRGAGRLSLDATTAAAGTMQRDYDE
jgi:hypothetical protein